MINKSHKILKEQAKRLLQKRGFSKDEIVLIIPPNMSSEEEETVRKALGFERAGLWSSKE
ncbi:MAG: hypothetical protein H8D26_09585 [Methanomicrobia archaeon]|nr:hypothetical protein [Methanomicrobia archaeon]